MVIQIPRTIKKQTIRFPELFFLLGLFLKQFYMRSSGSVQISDAVIMLSALMLIVSGRMRFSKIDTSLACFVICTFLVNGAYALYYNYIDHQIYDHSFLLASIYLLYNYIVILAFRVFMIESNFCNALTITMKINLLTQLVIYLSNSGRLYGGLRYQGTFNDPNQFSFFVLCCVFMLYLCHQYKKTRLHWFWFIIVAILILASASRGMTVAFLIFLFFSVVQPILSQKKPIYRFVAYVTFILLIVFYLMGGKNILSYILGSAKGSTAFLLERFTSRAGSSGILNRIITFFDDRGLMRILVWPEYFFFGCGEGYWERFWYSSDSGEMHSTMIALCYYYGIAPYFLFIKWLRDNISRVPKSVIGIYVALILEACTLVNHRQPLFWLIFVMGSLISRKLE